MRQIIFDTETTGFKPQEGHRLVEIGAVEMNDGSLTGATFHTYVNPERDVPPGAYNVHKLSTAFLANKPVFSDPTVGPSFLAFVQGAELIAHNASFDMGFIQFELARAGLGELDNAVIDTLALARKKYPGSPASLDALCGRFGIDTTQRERDGHGALLDARLLAKVYIELTGGIQAGLQLTTDITTTHNQSQQEDTPQRPQALAVLLTQQEKEAHTAFVGEMQNAIWHKQR